MELVAWIYPNLWSVQNFYIYNYNTTIYTLFICIASRAGVTKRESSLEDWQLICMCALSKLENVCMQIKTGDISVMELKEIREKQDQMRRLCDAAAAGEGESETSLSSSNLVVYVSQRLNEYNFFLKYHRQLDQLISFFTSKQLPGYKCKHACMCLSIL